MNWGTDDDGKLWLQPEVHIVCADTLVKGHMAQCKATNGLISKSWNKVAKLASKVPDYEHQFDAFCWDILVRLKLPLQVHFILMFCIVEKLFLELIEVPCFNNIFCTQKSNINISIYK